MEDTTLESSEDIQKSSIGQVNNSSKTNIQDQRAWSLTASLHFQESTRINFRRANPPPLFRVALCKRGALPKDKLGSKRVKKLWPTVLTQGQEAFSPPQHSRPQEKTALIRIIYL